MSTMLNQLMENAPAVHSDCMTSHPDGTCPATKDSQRDALFQAYKEYKLRTATENFRAFLELNTARGPWTYKQGLSVDELNIVDCDGRIVAHITTPNLGGDHFEQADFARQLADLVVSSVNKNLGF